jgi:hypothetical protein
MAHDANVTVNFDPHPPAAVPTTVAAPGVERIGRYRVQRVLGQGGFGQVYLAYDDQLSRHVAVKTPHARLVARAEDAEAYLREARTVARLEHSGIVPVYDCGATKEFPCYVVFFNAKAQGCQVAKKANEPLSGLVPCVFASLRLCVEMPSPQPR